MTNNNDHAMTFEEWELATGEPWDGSDSDFLAVGGLIYQRGDHPHCDQCESATEQLTNTPIGLLCDTCLPGKPGVSEFEQLRFWHMSRVL